MTFAILLAWAALTPWISQAQELRSNSFGVVVNISLLKGFETKYGVSVTSNTGRHLLGHARLSAGVGPRNGGTAGYGGIGLPEWINVSWRIGDFIQRYDPETNSVWTGGTIVGNHRLHIASRIPPEVIAYANAERGRSIKLMIRLLDDDVVLGWCVQEPAPVGRNWVFSHFGGDYLPAKWFNGQVVTPGWYLNRKTGQRVPTDTGH